MDKMETTENLGLKKPSQDDYYNVDDFNYNADAIDEFCGRTDNPHNVTKEQVGLGNVDNTADKDKSVKYATSAGSANAVAWGNVSGKPSAFTPASHTHDDKANVEDVFLNRGLFPNGASVMKLQCGIYQCTPNTLPAEGIPSGYNGYGSIAVLKGSYQQIIYCDVCGNMAFYNTHAGGWNNGAEHLRVKAGGRLDTTTGPVYNFGIWDASGGTGLDGVYNNGFSQSRWKNVFSANGTINTSDRNMKDNIKSLEEWHYQLFLKLIPSSFIFKDGGDRTHVGFISQDVEDALHELGKTAMDFAGFCKDVKVKLHLDEDGNVVNEPVLDEDGNPVYIYSLRYSEFIALAVYALQRVILEKDSMKEDMAEMKKDMAEMMNTINELREAVGA